MAEHGDPAEVADACVAAGLPELAAGFIRTRASMAVVQAGLLVNARPVYARLNGQASPKPSRPAAASGIGGRVDATAVYSRFNDRPAPAASATAEGSSGARPNPTSIFSRMNAAAPRPR